MCCSARTKPLLSICTRQTILCKLVVAVKTTIALCVCSFALLHDAAADGRRTTEAVTLRKKPGEKEAAVVQLPAGTEVEVLAENGRWLRVRVNKVEGFLARTTVSNPDAPVMAPTGNWSAARHPNSEEITELFVEVTAPTSTLRSAPKPDAASVVEVPRGGHLVVLDAGSNPSWIHARDEQGHDGWIARDQIDNGASSVVVTGVDLKGLGMSPDAFVRRPQPKLALRADVGIGFRSLGMDLTSNASGGLTNYVVDADAIAATLDVDAVKRFAGRAFVAGDARLQLSDSSPGINYPGPTSAAGKIPFETFAADVGVRAGLRAKQVFDLSLRAGVHYDAFVTRSVDNVGMLPRERLLGATLGLHADVAPPRSRFAVTARFDAIVIGARAQTPGLEDGQSNTAHGLWGGITVRYLLGHHLSVLGGYDLGRETTSWTGMSTREPGVTNAHRVDSTQLIQIGFGAEL